MFPPAITTSNKWSKQFCKQTGKWKQFLQKWDVGRAELLFGCIASLLRLNSTHSSSCVFTYSAHQCSIMNSARSGISLVYAAIIFSLIFIFKLLKKFWTTHLWSYLQVMQIWSASLYSYSKFILNAMPFKSDNEKNVFSYNFHHASWHSFSYTFLDGGGTARKTERRT